MTPDLQDEFAKLSSAAGETLKAVPMSGSYRRVFSFWAFPSFTPSFCWTVYSPHPVARSKPPFADYTVWRSDIDLEKLRSPVERLKYPKDLRPTIEGESLPLTSDVIEAMESAIRSVAIPIFLGEPSTIGCDGSRYEFQYDQMFFGASLHWWESYPKEWRPFTSAIGGIVGDLETRRKEEPNSEGSVAP